VVVGKIVEKTWEGRVPCEQATDVPIANDKRRLDQDILEEVAFGVAGADGTPRKAAPRQLERHVATLASFGKCGKGHWLENRLHKHMVRYFLAGRQHFQDVDSLCISLDASRIGGKEVYIGVVGGFSKSTGQGKVMWAPPQEQQQQQQQ
jgi:hypothetical protein